MLCRVSFPVFYTEAKMPLLSPQQKGPFVTDSLKGHTNIFKYLHFESYCKIIQKHWQFVIYSKCCSPTIMKTEN